MLELFSFLITIVIALIVSWLIVFWVDYSSHVSSTKEKKCKYDYVTFDTFMRVFNKYVDKISFNNSRFSCYPDVYVDEDIIKFGDKCMILYPIDYIKFKWWIRKYKNSNMRQKGLWEE